MKLAMAQMRMSESMDENLRKDLAFADEAAGSDLLFFPEVQLSPFFAQYKGRDASQYLLDPDDCRLQAIADKCREHGMYISPNVYLRENGRPYDASLFLDRGGNVQGISKMVHIFSAPEFWECDYYTAGESSYPRNFS